MANDGKYQVQALRTMEDVVEALQALEGAGVTAVAEHIDRPQSVVHNHLVTLQKLEYVVKTGTEYRLGFRYLERGEIVRHRSALYTTSKPHVRSLAEETRELITLIVEEHGRGVYLDVEQANEDIQYPAIPGTRILLHCSAAGKTILAHLPEERTAEIIDRHGLPAQTENTITDREALFDELEAIRDRGYAFDMQEFREGMRSIGAPIFDGEKSVLGAMSVAGPTHRIMGERRTETLPDRLLQTVNVIELNYNEPVVK